MSPTPSSSPLLTDEPGLLKAKLIISFSLHDWGSTWIRWTQGCMSSSETSFLSFSGKCWKSDGIYHWTGSMNWRKKPCSATQFDSSVPSLKYSPYHDNTYLIMFDDDHDHDVRQGSWQGRISIDCLIPRWCRPLVTIIQNLRWRRRDLDTASH